MSFSTDVKNEILELKIWNTNSSLKQDEQIARLCVREAFIKSGFINDPEKDYHLEIFFKKEKKAEELITILQTFNIIAKITKKGTGTIIYIKDGEDISKFLALIGATKSVLKFEEIRVMKDTRNNINRLVNCETANLNKTIDASVIQIEDILFLKKIGKFKELSSSLQEIAELRIKNPDASYEELGKMLLKQIGKSGVSHRFTKIHKIAEENRV